MKINQDGKVKAHDMAKALEVSCRTIYRDIDVLCEAGYPIVTTKGQQGGITFVKGYKLNLEQTDVMLQTLISHLYSIPEKEKLVNALESGMNLKYMSVERPKDERKQKIFIDRKGWWEEASTEIELEPIMTALFLQHKLQIQYTKIDGTKSERRIAPYGLVLKSTAWYLVAFCYISNEIRTFHCSRMKCMAVLQESFTMPDDFHLKKYWDFSTNAFKESKKEREYYPVIIKVSKEFEAIFEKYDIVGLKREGNYVIAKIDLHRRDVAEQDIRAFLGYGQILYPEEMRIKAKTIIENYTRLYKE